MCTHFKVGGGGAFGIIEEVISHIVWVAAIANSHCCLN